MSEFSSRRPYRVRPAVENERSVPADAQGPRFPNREDAESYAHSQHHSLDKPMILEKLAPSGCWLQVGLVL